MKYNYELFDLQLGVQKYIKKLSAGVMRVPAESLFGSFIL